MIKAVITDLDETLIRARPTHERSLKAAMIACGYNVKNPKWKYGLTVEELIKMNVPSIKRSDVAKVAEVKAALLNKYLGYARPLPWANVLLKFLKKNNIKVALVTNNSKRDLDKLLGRLRWENYFDVLLYKGEAPSKPHPDLILLALKKLKLAPSEAIYLGDSDSDLLAAEKAGVDMILNKYVHDQTKHTKLAEYVVSNLHYALLRIKELIKK